MIDLTKYNNIADEEKVPVFDSEDQKQKIIPKSDFDLDRGSDSQRYTFSAEKGFFLNPQGKIVPADTEDFYSFYDDQENYKYLDADILEVAATPKEDLSTGEKLRDILPKGKFGTAVSNVWDGLIKNVTLHTSEYVDKQTRKQSLSEKRLREEAGFVGGVGTVLGEVGGVLGVTGATAATGGAALGALGGIRALPKVAKAAQATKKFFKTGQGLKHTAAIGASYTAPYAISSAINQKDIGKGVEEMAYGTLIPFGAHLGGKAIKAPLTFARDKVRQSFFQLPDKIGDFNKVKGNLIKQVKMSPDSLLPEQYAKIAGKRKIERLQGVLPKNYTIKDKEEILNKMEKDDVLDIMTNFTKRAADENRAAGKLLNKGLSWTRDGTFESVHKFQQTVGKEIGKIRDLSGKFKDVFELKGSEIREALIKSLPKQQFLDQSSRSAIRKFAKLIRQVDPNKKYSLSKMKELRDVLEDSAKFAKKTEPKFTETMYRGGYSSLSELEEVVIKRAGSKVKQAIQTGKGNKKGLSELNDRLTDFNKVKANFAKASSTLDILDNASAQASRAGGITGSALAERILIYGGIGYAAGGLPAAGAALLATKGFTSGWFFRPAEAISDNLGLIGKFTKKLADKASLGRPKETAAATIASIHASMLGDENKDGDLNQLAVGLGASMGQPEKNNQGSSRAVMDGLFSDLNINTPHRKLETAKLYNRMEQTLLKNMQIIKKDDPEAEDKKEQFVKDVAVLFSPKALMSEIQSAEITDKQIDNFRSVYPRMYNKMRNDILSDNAKNPLVDRLDYDVVLALGKFVGHDLTGLENLPQPQEAPPIDERPSQKKNNAQYKFDDVDADLRKEIYSSKNNLQTAENF